MSGGEEGAAEKSGFEELKNAKLMLFNLLQLLKHFYSFKQLEETLGVPAQVLWRYSALRATPERETVQKLLRRIKESGLVEEAIRRSLDEGGGWLAYTNIGLLGLAALGVAEKLAAEKKGRVGVIVTIDEAYSVAFATMLSYYLRARLCVASSRLYEEQSLVDYCITGARAEALALPHRCLSKKPRVLLVAATEPAARCLEALVRLVKRAKAPIIGVVVDREERARLVEGKGERYLVIPVLPGAGRRDSAGGSAAVGAH